MRLAKYLAHAGVASRRSAETLIGAGRVSVEGEIVTDPARDVGEESRVAVDGRPLAGPSRASCTPSTSPSASSPRRSDTHGRPTVVELVPEQGLRLYPVGRLDADTSGLILLTNDGELANRLTHPRFEVPKTYRAKLGGGPVGQKSLERPARRGASSRTAAPRPPACAWSGRTDRAHDPRGPQPPGAAHVRGRRAPRARAAARRLRPAAARRAWSRVSTGG